MALPDSTSLAPITSASVDNVQFAAVAENLSRKILLTGTYDPSILTIVDDTPEASSNAAATGSKYGFGFELHRMHLAAERWGGQIETIILPQAEAGGAVQAEGTITVSVTTAESGSLFLYIAGDRVVVPVVAGATDAEIATAIVTAVTADANLPVTAAAALAVATLTTKSGGTYGNDISIEFNLGAGEETAAGVSTVVVDMASGATDPDIQDALDGLGTGDASNSIFATDCIHGYGLVAAQLDAISIYNGIGNTPTGCYAPTVDRPMRWLNGDVAPGSAGLTAIKAVAAGRKLDRSSGVVCAPGSAAHPVELACEVAGYAAATNQAFAALGYVDQPLTVNTGATGDRWTDEYSDRDTANKSGVGTTVYENGILTIQKLVTFYRPDDVPVSSNGYRSYRNISILQNLLVSNNTNLAIYKGKTIVEDVQKVAGPDAETVVDVDVITNKLNQIADAQAGKSWLYSASYTKENLEVTVRTLSNGFDYTYPIVLSGEGDIINGVIQFDVALTVFV